MWLLHVRARALPRLERNEEAMAVAEEVFAAWVSQKNPMITGRAYHLLATTYGDCGRTEALEGLLQLAVEQLRVSQVQDFLIRAMRSLAQEELRLGNMQAYRDLETDTRELANALGDMKTIGLLDALEGRRARFEGDSSGMARRYESAIMLAGDSERVVDSYSTALMAAFDFAQAGHHAIAHSILQAAEGLRVSSNCGQTTAERLELEVTIGIVGEVEPDLNVRSGRDLAKKVLTVSGEIR